MNMFSVWTLSSLILSYTLAFPIPNDTSTDSSMAFFPNSTEVKGNSMESSILPNFTDQGNGSRGGVPFILGCRMCLLPTCNVHRLPNRLQTGDEKAGKLTQDPYGSESVQMTPTFEGNRSRDGVYGGPSGGRMCLLPTCNVHKLPDWLQKGDEKAGTLTQDPYGPGKK